MTRSQQQNKLSGWGKKELCKGLGAVFGPIVFLTGLLALGNEGIKQLLQVSQHPDDIISRRILTK